MMESAPLTFDRRTGRLTGAGMVESAAVAALQMGSLATYRFRHRGYSLGCKIVSSVIAQRDVIVRLNEDSVFSFPLGDAYWSRLLNRHYTYEFDLDHFLRQVVAEDYQFVDCGANFGIWSVLVTSAAFGRHRAVAIEASPANASRLQKNADLNGNRFKVLNRAIGQASGVKVRIAGTKHEALSILPSEHSSSGEEVITISLDGLLDAGFVKPEQRVIVKLDVEGVEVDAIRGGQRLLAGDAVVVCEDHGSDTGHALTRFLLNETPYRLFMFDKATNKFERIADIAALERIKTMSWVGYNVFATTSRFWEEQLLAVKPMMKH